MKSLFKNKVTNRLIIFLMLANALTLLFYWGGRIKQARENSPKQFLASKLNFTDRQKELYFDLAKDHNEHAKIIRQQIKIDKEQLFQLLKSDHVIDSTRNKAALKVSLSIQSLDILTFEHFKKVRAICTEEQKPAFDELIQKMVNSVNSPQQGPLAPMK